MPGTAVSPRESPRVDWVDYAKGICIVMVVMMHSSYGVDLAAGSISWMKGVVDFARPFRMPDFFLIAGLFLARVIDRDWRDYLNRKVAHFAYFYAIWVTIQFALRAPRYVAEQGVLATAGDYLVSYIEPFGPLWFIYLLPVFFLATKLVRRLPWWLVLIAAAALQVAPIETGSTVIDEFAERYVFFFAGYALAPRIFDLARRAQAHWGKALAGLAVWAPVNGALVAAGVSMAPFVSLVLGFAGAAAVVAAAGLLARLRLADALRYCGEHSLVVYLAFSPFMAGARVVLLKANVIPDLGVLILLVTAAGVTGPLLLHLAVRNTQARYLFVRPAWARLKPAPARAPLQPAE